MNYLIAVLNDRTQAEAAYSALQKEGLSIDKVNLLGKGHKLADDFGLIKTKAKTAQQTKLMALWLVPFGFVAGFMFSYITGLETFAWAGDIGNHLIGALLGSISGAMGSYFVGGNINLWGDDRNELPYANQLEAGKYIIVVRGADKLTQQAKQVLGHFETENIQGYADPMSI